MPVRVRNERASLFDVCRANQVHHCVFARLLYDHAAVCRKIVACDGFLPGQPPDEAADMTIRWTAAHLVCSHNVYYVKHIAPIAHVEVFLHMRDALRVLCVVCPVE